MGGSPFLNKRCKIIAAPTSAGWPPLLLEHLAKCRQLLRVENCFDSLVGAIPDGAHLLRWPSRTAAAFCAARAVGGGTTSASTASSTAHSTSPSTTAPSPSPSPSSALTAGVFPQVLHLHCFVGQDRADFSLLRGIELQRLRQFCHPLVDHLTRIHSRPVGGTLLLRILAPRGGGERDTPDDGRANYRGERQTPSSMGNLPDVHYSSLPGVVRIKVDRCALIRIHARGARPSA
jgi:hypothetical protein